MNKQYKPKAATIEYRGKRIEAIIVDNFKDGRITVSWDRHIRITGKPEELKLKIQ